jgi:hypothetical protein
VSTPAPVELLSCSRVAVLFGVSPATASRWGKEGRLLTWPTLGGIRRFFAVEVGALLAGQSREAARKLAEPERERLRKPGAGRDGEVPGG